MNFWQKYYFRTKLSFLFAVGLVAGTINAQNWENVHQIGGTGNENILGMIAEEGGNLLITGTFTENFVDDGFDFTTYGGTDVFLSQINESGTIQWKITVGSPETDETIHPVRDSEGNIYWAGMFWDSITFNSAVYHTTNHGKGIYLLKIAEDQSIHWGKVFSGTGIKTVVDIKESSNGNLFMTGYFSDTLFLDETILVSEGERDIFLIEINPLGEVLLSKQIGLTGKARTTSMAINENGTIILGGRLQGSIAFAGDTIASATNDEDVFLLKTNIVGDECWIRRAGGVYDDIATAVTMDESENVYVTGKFTGVMTLSEDIEINTLGYDDDFFLLKYSANGHPELARSMGGGGYDEVTTMAYDNGKLILTGYFQESFEVDDYLFNAGEDDYAGFVGAFDESLIAGWIFPFHCTGFAKGSVVECAGDGSIYIGGSFNASMEMDEEQLTSSGGYDLFYGKLTKTTVSIDTEQNTQEIKIFPNPTNDVIFINLEAKKSSVEIYDVYGKCVYKDEDIYQINVNNWAIGIYFGHIRSDEGEYYFKFVKRDN